MENVVIPICITVFLLGELVFFAWLAWLDRD